MFDGVSPTEVAKRTWMEIRADDVFGRAAQLAYYFFLALFPFLIFVIASLSVFGYADRGRAVMFHVVSHFLPGPASQLITSTFEAILRSGGPLKMSFGIVFSVWSASMGMGAVLDALNAIYRVKEKRSLVKQYAIALGLTVGLGILIVISVLLVVFGNDLVEAMSHGGLLSIVWKIARWPLGIALLLLAFAITYYFAPDVANRKWHWVTPGAIAGTILLALISIGLRIYLRYAGASPAEYGPLGAVIVLLLAFYLCGIALLSGGALNGVLDGISTADHRALEDSER